MKYIAGACSSLSRSPAATHISRTMLFHPRFPVKEPAADEPWLDVNMLFVGNMVLVEVGEP